PAITPGRRISSLRIYGVQHYSHHGCAPADRAEYEARVSTCTCASAAPRCRSEAADGIDNARVALWANATPLRRSRWNTTHWHVDALVHVAMPAAATMWVGA